MPHSEIPGSPIARISPGLFAACHVLHRLSVPRHPPDALLFALDHASPSPATPHHRRAQGQTPCLSPQEAGRRPRMKTLLSDEPKASAACPGPVRLGHITTLSVPFNQRRRGRPRRCRQIFSERRFGDASGSRTQHRWFADGGGERIRTDDLLLAKQALSQLSYTPLRDRQTRWPIRNSDA